MAAAGWAMPLDLAVLHFGIYPKEQIREAPMDTLELVMQFLPWASCLRRSTYPISRSWDMSLGGGSLIKKEPRLAEVKEPMVAQPGCSRVRS